MCFMSLLKAVELGMTDIFGNCPKILTVCRIGIAPYAIVSVRGGRLPRITGRATILEIKPDDRESSYTY